MKLFCLSSQNLDYTSYNSNYYFSSPPVPMLMYIDTSFSFFRMANRMAFLFHCNVFWTGEIIVQGRKRGVVPGGILGEFGTFRDFIDMDDIPAYSSLGGGVNGYKKNENMVVLLDGELVWGVSPTPALPELIRNGWMDLYYQFIPAGLQRTRFSIILAAKGDSSIRKFCS